MFKYIVTAFMFLSSTVLLGTLSDADSNTLRVVLLLALIANWWIYLIVISRPRASNRNLAGEISREHNAMEGTETQVDSEVSYVEIKDANNNRLRFSRLGSDWYTSFIDVYGHSEFGVKLSTHSIIRLKAWLNKNPYLSNSFLEGRRK
jgi:hypothetical protein